MIYQGYPSVRGASDAAYPFNAFGDELLTQLQLNVHRLDSCLRPASCSADS
jgi:hypothetical protein